VEAENNNVSLQNQAPWRKWIGLGVLSLGLAIVIIDTTLLNVSLTNIIADLKTDLQSLQWVITAYALVLAAFTITGGRFGDLFGRVDYLGSGLLIGERLSGAIRIMPKRKHRTTSQRQDNRSQRGGEPR